MKWMLALWLVLSALPSMSQEYSAQSDEKTYIIGFQPWVSREHRLETMAQMGVVPVESLDEIDSYVVALKVQKVSFGSLSAFAENNPDITLVEEDFYDNWLINENISFQNFPLPSLAQVQKMIGPFQRQPWTAPALPAGVSPAELPWGIRRVNAPGAWDVTMGEGVRVAVVDTGIDASHPDLSGNVAGGFNAIDPSKPYLDDNMHGTHVAGTIAGILDGKGVVGVAPKAKLYAVKVLNAKGGGYVRNIVRGILWCAKNNIQVANMSLGSGIPPLSLKLALKHAASKGVVVIAAAGNSGGRVSYPAGFKETIAVSASDNNDKIANFSCRGNKINFIAPGVKVKSSIPNNKYAEYSGTSMAAPHVTGLAALAVSRGAQGIDGVRAALQRGAKSIGLKPVEEGFGMIDAGAMVH